MAIKDFFWTFGEDGLDKYINKLIEENGNEFSGEEGRSLKKVSDKFDRICKIFGIDYLFRADNNISDEERKIQYVIGLCNLLGLENFAKLIKNRNENDIEIEKSEKEDKRQRKAGYCFEKNLGCKVITSIPIEDRKELCEMLDKDQHDQVIDKICDEINVGGQKDKYDYKNILSLINKDSLHDDLSKSCFMEMGSQECTCSLFLNGKCVPLLIKAVFDIYDEKTYLESELFAVDECAKLNKYFYELIPPFTSTLEYRKNIEKFCNEYMKDLNVNLFSDIQNIGTRRQSLKKELSDIMRNFATTIVIEEEELTKELAEYIRILFRTTTVGKIYSKENHEERAMLIIDEFCLWYVLWNKIIDRYRMYRHMEYQLDYEDEENDEHVKIFQDRNLLEEVQWEVIHNNLIHDNIEDDIKKLSKHYRGIYEDEYLKLLDEAKEDGDEEVKLQEIINKLLPGVCNEIVSDFYRLSKEKMIDTVYGEIMDDKEYQEIEELTRIDLRKICQHLALGWKTHDMLYMTKNLEKEAKSYMY